MLLCFYDQIFFLDVHFKLFSGLFYQYEAMVTRYTRLLISVIKRSNHYAYLGGHYFIISFCLTPLHVILIRRIQQRHRMDLITTLVD